MTWLQAIIVYFVCWWLLFFMALPVGIQQEEHPEEGHDLGAPHNPQIRIKGIIVSVLAVVVTWGIDLLVHSGIVTVR